MTLKTLSFLSNLLHWIVKIIIHIIIINALSRGNRDMQSLGNVWSWNSIQLVTKMSLFNRGDELYDANNPAGLSSNPSISFHICQKIIVYAIQWTNELKKLSVFKSIYIYNVYIYTYIRAYIRDISRHLYDWK